MKKIISILMMTTMIFSLTACGSSAASQSTADAEAAVDVEQAATANETAEADETDGDSADSEATAASEEVADEAVEEAVEEAGETATDAAEDTTGANALVVYFSATGNTKAAAETLAELQNADIYEIIPEQPYTEEDLNYNDRSTRATVEQDDANARPAISGSIENIESYDVIYVGYPIWWGDMPRILYTFFDTYDLAGKTIAPFCTSGGSGLSGTPQAIAELEAEATVTDGLQIGSSAASDAEGALTEWISSIGL